MKLVITENVEIEQKYDLFDMGFVKTEEVQEDTELDYARMLGYNPTKIFIKGIGYDVIPLHVVARKKSSDGYYRFIYIQINMVTNEFYIGKVNRKKFKEVLRYQGSGLLFTNKYSKNKDEFVRYYIAACDSQEETELLEAKIVDDVLLKDEKCLNLVKGGGGINNQLMPEERKERQRKYMKEHPEQYQAMIETAKGLYCSGNTVQLEQRANKIKATMSSEKYREMSRERILKWKEENPEEYAKARENNRIVQSSEKTRKKRSDAFKKWREENPEEYLVRQNKLIEARTSEEANNKRASSLKTYYKNNPKAKEQLKQRAEKARQKQKKRTNMVDLESGKILNSFDSQHDAARWLVEKGYAKNMNCVSSINAVCLGHRKKAYGFGWELIPKLK